jgi:two-component system, chemotaxis family, CheB/CheR fusion protein
MQKSKSGRGGADTADQPKAGEPTSTSRSTPRFPVAGVGASAGGMEAFIEFLRQIPPDCGMAFVLIQHLDPTHASSLSEALARSTRFPVHEIQDGMQVHPDHVYVIPPNADVGLLNGRLTLLRRATEERRPHRAVDFFFKALAADCRNQAIGVVLSGTGSDGAEGLRAIKEQGGVTFAQYPGSARFSGMPEAAIATGAVDFPLPIPALARELVRMGRHPSVRERAAEVLTSPTDERDLKQVLVLLRNAEGIDFSEYKLTSMRRRLARRMAVRKMTTLEEYLRLLREEPAEPRALLEDILTHVTSFFRDGETFEKLKEHVFPEILKKKQQQAGTIRIWSAGCSTGQEAYSVLISLSEFLAEQNASHVPIQLFGTDISEKAIDLARAGFYPEAAARDLGPERLATFFAKAEGGGYKVNKPIRERCAFVKHDLVRDPPFSKLDLVCCRNVLVYFSQELQKRALATLHFALSEPGFLLLGHAENIVERTNLFQAIDKESRIFARTAVKSTLRLAPAQEVFPGARQTADELRSTTPADLVRRTESLLLDRYAPPGVVVNERLEILHFCGRTGPYLEPSPGQPGHDLLRMARKGLVAELRIALSQARKEKTTVRRPGVQVEQDGPPRLCDVVVLPLASSPGSTEDAFAVVFEEPKPPQPPPAARGSPVETGATSARVAALEDELNATREYLQSIIEEQQRTAEELTATNDEFAASNEELLSLNEELQTAKEELQSTNEELSTLNDELQTRNADLDSVNDDLVNILASVEVAIVIVDSNRRIRRFTPQARPILNLLPSDVGRPIDDIKPTLAIEDLDQKIAEVIDTVGRREEEVTDRAGRWYRLQIRPFTTVDKKIDGAVLSVVDIDVLKRALAAAEWARDYANATVEAIQTPLLVLDDKLTISSANEAFQDHYGLDSAELASRSLFAIMNGAWDVAELRSALQRVIEREERFQRLELDVEAPHLGRRTLSLSGRSISAPGRRLILLAVEDISARRRSEAERDKLLHQAETAQASAEDANRTKDLFLATLSHELRTPLTSLLLQAQLLRRGSLDEAGLQKTGETIERATRAQARLIEDLLDTSRIVAGKLTLQMQEVGLASVVQAAVETAMPTAPDKQIEIEVHLDRSLPPVSADPLRLQQAVWNLVVNAVKFTPERGRVTVTVDAVDGRGRIRVSDTGIGVEPRFLPNIFNHFSQEDRGPSRAHGGLGLGLAIVRYVAEAHGGSVQAESAGKGQGSTFTMLLPLMKQRTVPAPPPEGPPGARVSGNIKDVRVLLVEDDAPTREALTVIIGEAGAEVQSVESAQAAMQIFERFRPQLLVCDIAMPAQDGYTLLARVRALGARRGGDLPALALTALAGEEDRRRILEAGFQAHVAKPFDIDQLNAALTALVKQPAPGPSRPLATAES